jgi:hypothetical protein
MRAPRRLLLPLLLLSLACGGCAPAVDLTKGLPVLDVSTGWIDVGIVNGQNKLVPSITFKLKNLSDQKLIALQVNAMFRRVNSPDDWGSGYVIVAQSEGLAPGATSRAFTIQSTLGYTGLEPRADMLKNKEFVDAKVELAAKYGSVQWTRIGDHPIERRLLTP